MPTIDLTRLVPWLPQGTIKCESDAALARDVAVKAATESSRAGLTGKVIRPVPGLHGMLSADTADILLKLGRNLTPPGQFLASLWPIVKYLRFFETTTNGELACRDFAGWYVEHGRGTVSDELGSALSLFTAEVHAQQSVPGATVNFFDVERELRNARPTVENLGQNHRRRPDWIVCVQSDNTVPNYFALESKGTGKSSRGNHLEPLAKASIQLTDISIDGKIPPGIAVSSATETHSPIVQYVIDPAGETEPIEIDRMALRLEVEGLLTNPDLLRLNLRGPEASNIYLNEVVHRAAARTVQRLAEWAGHPMIVDAGARGRVSVETTSGRARGIVTELPKGVHIFQGCMEVVAEALDERDYLGALAWKKRDRPRPRTEASLPRAVHRAGNVAIDSNGAVLALWRDER